MINQVALLNEQKEKLTAEELTVKIGLKGVAATGFFEHTKASERYVVLSVVDGGEANWKERECHIADLQETLDELWRVGLEQAVRKF